MTASITADRLIVEEELEPPRRERRPLRSRLLGTWAFVVYAWLFAPLLVMVLFSFNRPVGKFNTAWNEFTPANALPSLPAGLSTLG